MKKTTLVNKVKTGTTNGHPERVLYPRSRYHGEIAPENLMFNTNLQKFAQRVSYTVNLETGGKMSVEEACQHLETLWQQFESASQQLIIAGKFSPVAYQREE